MQVFGNIASAVEQRMGKNNRPFFTFRLAENQGKDEYKTTTWYDVSAFISELDADLLAKGQFVKVTGRLEVQPFKRKNGDLGASASILTNSILPVERKEPRQGEAGSAGEPRDPEQGQRAPARTPAPAPARTASGFDDMGDDIPF